MVVDCQRAIARLWAGLLALLVVVGAGCEGKEEDRCETEDPPPPECNKCPITSGVIPDDTILVGDTVRLNVTDYFRDEDTLDVLVYTAQSSDTSTVEVAMTGSVLTFHGVNGGKADVAVTAADEFDCSAKPATQEFEVVVLFPNRPPVCGWSLPPPPFIFPVGLSDELLVPCVDPDGDDLRITAVSSDPDVFSVTLVEGGERIAFEALAVGTAVLTVTATDPEGLSGRDSADIIIVEEG